MTGPRRAAAAALMTMVAPRLAHAQAQAQAQVGPTLAVEASTDERRRGLSWSEGDPALSADVGLTIAGFDAGARVVSLRGSPRHLGADAVVDLTLGRGWDLGAVRVNARATGHLFAGAGAGMDFYELGGDASYSLGPVRATAGAILAPSQRAVGGTNLYLFAGASAGVPMTPFTLSAAIGRTTGTDGRTWSDRLRPGGDYTDWRVGADYVLGPITLGLDYVDTDRGDRPATPIGDPANSGERIVARARFGF